MGRGWTIGVLALAGLVGCYDARVSSCAYRCATGGVCPSGTSCGVDDYCHAPGEMESCVPDAGLPLAPCDPQEQVDPGQGVFVSGEDGSAGGQGTMDSPLDTISAALVQARATSKSKVYVEKGTYAEVLDIRDSMTGVIVDGAWTYSGLVWTRDCAEDRVRLTLVRPAAPTAVTFTDVMHMSGLSNLSVGTAARAPSTPADTAGGSRVAIIVSGAGSAIRLFNVLVLPGDGDHGGAATAGTAGAGVVVCDGMNPPDDLDVDCTTGAIGAAGTAGASASMPGTFTAAGFTASDGAPGVDPGMPGANGTPGEPTFTRNDCNDCGCGLCISNRASPVTAVGGKCGCGGNPGGPGAAGRGGGASVGLLVSGTGSTISVEFSLLYGGDGGDGSTGGAAGPGATGSLGMAGTGAWCYEMDCINTCPTCTHQAADTAGIIAPRASGESGGTGGSGGGGGGGAGGPSYPVVTLDGARVLLDAMSQRLPGTGGAGGGGALAGEALQQLDL